MKAAVLNQIPGELVIEDISIDKPGPGEVLVQTVNAGLCHSDLHFMDGQWSRLPLPAVMGHESAGIVQAVGPDVTYVKPGDHVITCLSIFCGNCEHCLTGHPNRCQNSDATSRAKGSAPRLSRSDRATGHLGRGRTGPRPPPRPGSAAWSLRPVARAIGAGPRRSCRSAGLARAAPHPDRMEAVTVKELIEAGVHFGCPVSRWNPKMAPYIHGRRNLIHVMDLRETLRGLLRAQNFLYHVAAEGQQILWVGTKRQIKGVIHDAGQRTGMPVVTERWIGGTLTNFSVIRSRLRRLEELETMEEDGSMEIHSKKMVSTLRRERRKIERNLGGIREMGAIPGAIVVVDPGREANAVREFAYVLTRMP